MADIVANTVRCPHCASTDAAPSGPRFSPVPLSPANEPPAATEAALPAAGEKKRNALRRDLAKAKAALAEQQERTARAKKEAATVRRATAALREGLAAETERANRLEREAAHRAAAALLDRGSGQSPAEFADAQSVVLAATERAEALAQQLAGLREELATCNAAAAAELADAQSALLAATERVDALEQQLANQPSPVDAEPLQAEIQSLRQSLARESERRAKLERDFKDLREGWAYDLARRRAESAGSR